MPANPITALTDRRVLNRILNKRIKPFTALTNLIFPASTKKNLVEEYAQVDVKEGTYGMAPFVKVGDKSFMVGALNGTSYTIETPFISINRPLTYSSRLAKRLAGQQVFTNAEMTRAAIREAIAEDADYMNTLIDDRIEWMVAYLLRGQIDYSAEGHDSFTISTGKPAANTFTVSVLWTDGAATPFEDITDAKKVVSARRGPAPNIGICGASAAAALRALAETDKLTALKTTSGISAGRADLIANIENDGMLHIGKFGGVEFFEYTGTFNPDDGGAAEPFIRAEYVEFFSTGPRSLSERQLMFGMIPDLKAIMAGLHVTERYFTSKLPEEDAGTYVGYVKSRPFPWLYRADWQVSMKVTA